MARGYSNYIINGVRIEATPWADRWLHDGALEAAAALLTARGLDWCRIHADRPGGPFQVRLSVCRDGRGATPLDALRAAVATTPERIEPDLKASLEAKGIES